MNPIERGLRRLAWVCGWGAVAMLVIAVVAWFALSGVQLGAARPGILSGFASFASMIVAFWATVLWAVFRFSAWVTSK